VKAHYEAGRYSDYNPSPPVANSADAEIFSAGQRLRDWARYLSKNSAIIKAVLDSRVAKGIGTGLRYEPMVVDRKGNLLPKLNEAIRDVMDRWAERVDVTGELSRAEVERLAWRDWDTAGEMFSRAVYRGRSAQQLGYQLQLIRSELVPYGWISNTGARMGIERDDWGAPKQYWVYPYAPNAYTWQYSVPAAKPQPVSAEFVTHLRRQEELDQTRGVTLFHAVIFRASDIAEYQQSHRRAARASANLFASINRDADFQPTDAPDSRSGDINLLDLQILDYLKAGESVNFHSPSHPNQNAVEFVNQELRQFAAACRVAFSWIAYVFDRAYAAQRTELIHAWELILEDRAHFIRDFAKPALYDEALRIALLEGRLPARELRKADPRTLYDCRIDGPAMPSIDPVKDRQSAALDQELGWDSRWAIIRRFGRDPVQVDIEREQDDFSLEASALTMTDTRADEEEGEANESEAGDE
jgi:lambda family phage portal protein